MGWHTVFKQVHIFKLMPETKTLLPFTYYDLTEKIAIVLGMFTFGILANV